MNPGKANEPWCGHTGLALWTYPSGRKSCAHNVSSTHRHQAGATPVTPRLPHIAACLAGAASALVLARLHWQVKSLNAGLDALDRGVIEASAVAGKAQLQASAAFRTAALTPEEAAETFEKALDAAEQAAGDTLVPRPGGLAPGHPESLVTGINPADEDELAERCTELWPNDEYLEITPEGPGAS